MFFYVGHLTTAYALPFSLLEDFLRMRERGRIFIQAECLKVARRQPGCGVLQSVLIAPISSEAGGPNWEIVSFLPDLPPLARLEAIKAIGPLRQKYALAARQPAK